MFRLTFLNILAFGLLAGCVSNRPLVLNAPQSCELDSPQGNYVAGSATSSFGQQ
jgi:hypothetical protein